MPAPDAFPGYRFATPEKPSVTGLPPGSPPVAISSYKPPFPPTSAAKAPAVPPAEQRSPTVVEALKRNAARP
jgi:hypothetical protein